MAESIYSPGIIAAEELGAHVDEHSMAEKKEILKEESKVSPTRDERKVELLKIPDQKRKSHEVKELEGICAQEKEERKLGVLVHDLIAGADRHGRLVIKTATREVTDRVKLFSAQEKAQLKSVNTRRTADKKDARKRTDKAMAELQQSLIENEKGIDDRADKLCAVILETFKAQYVGAEKQIEDVTTHITDVVGQFTLDIPLLDMCQLEELAKNGRVKISGEGKDTVYVTCPDFKPKEKTKIKPQYALKNS